MKIVVFLIPLALIIGGLWYLSNHPMFLPITNPNSSGINTQNTPSPQIGTNKDIPLTTVIAKNLDTPWAIAFLPDNSMLVTERPGRVRFIDANGSLDASLVTTISRVKEIGEGGLLGLTLHPNFTKNHYVYLYYTYSGNGSNTLNRVVRMTYADKKLSAEKIIVDQIPGSSNHNGGRIKFGPDSYLYITTGDAENPSLAQDKNALGGKILRVTDEGSAAPGNPFGNLTYSYGHRNPQGLAWDSNDTLWETEHGPSGGQFGTGHDEVNKIERGKNYGWPTIIGDAERAGMETAYVNSGNNTWAPADAAIKDNTLYFSGLRGQALYILSLTSTPGQIQTALKGELGRIREVIIGPDDMLYITTSNHDGRGNPKDDDDKVIRLNIQKLLNP